MMKKFLFCTIFLCFIVNISVVAQVSTLGEACNVDREYGTCYPTSACPAGQGETLTYCGSGNVCCLNRSVAPPIVFNPPNGGGGQINPGGGFTPTQPVYTPPTAPTAPTGPPKQLDQEGNSCVANGNAGLCYQVSDCPAAKDMVPECGSILTCCTFPPPAGSPPVNNNFQQVVPPPAGTPVAPNGGGSNGGGGGKKKKKGNFLSKVNGFLQTPAGGATAKIGMMVLGSFLGRRLMNDELTGKMPPAETHDSKRPSKQFESLGESIAQMLHGNNKKK